MSVVDVGSRRSGFHWVLNTTFHDKVQYYNKEFSTFLNERNVLISNLTLEKREEKVTRNLFWANLWKNYSYILELNQYEAKTYLVVSNVSINVKKYEQSNWSICKTLRFNKNKQFCTYRSEISEGIFESQRPKCWKFKLFLRRYTNHWSPKTRRSCFLCTCRFSKTLSK